MELKCVCIVLSPIELLPFYLSLTGNYIPIKSAVIIAKPYPVFIISVSTPYSSLIPKVMSDKTGHDDIRAGGKHSFSVTTKCSLSLSHSWMRATSGDLIK